MSNDIIIARPTPFDEAALTAVLIRALQAFRPGWVVEYRSAKTRFHRAAWTAKWSALNESEHPSSVIRIFMWSSPTAQTYEETPDGEIEKDIWPALVIDGGHSDLGYLIIDHIIAAVIKAWQAEGVEVRLDLEPARIPKLYSRCFDKYLDRYMKTAAEDGEKRCYEGAAVRAEMEAECWDPCWHPYIVGDERVNYKIKIAGD